MDWDKLNRKYPGLVEYVAKNIILSDNEIKAERDRMDRWHLLTLSDYVEDEITNCMEDFCEECDFNYDEMLSEVEPIDIFEQLPVDG